MEKLKENRGITLIVLVITIIVILILAGIVLNLTVGENGILKRTQQAGEQYKISEILEKLELEKVDLVAKKNGDTPSVQEYVEHLISKGIITTADVENIDDNTKNIIVDGYKFLVEKETNGNIKITYQGKADGKPKIANIQVIEVKPNSIKVKVITSQLNGGTFTYGIKNITTNETSYTVVASKISQNEYEFTGLIQDNEYKIEVKIENDKGEDTKQTNTAIKAELPPVSEISLNKTTLSIQKGSKETLTATVLPTNAKDTTVTWESCDESIATVSTTGEVTAVAEGTATITATANGGIGINATCSITVTPPPPPTAGVGGTTHSPKAIQYTWEELGEIAKVISNNYGTEEGKVNNQTVEVNVSINGKSDKLGIGDWTTVNGKKVRILGFNHDELVDQSVYGGANTYAGISFEYVDFIISGAAMNSTANNSGGWGACALRKTLNGTSGDKTNGTIAGLGNKEQIKKVKKEYIATYNNASSVTTSEDYLWLLSCSEIWNNGYQSGAYGYAITKEGERYKYYDVNLGDLGFDKSSSVTSKSTKYELVWLRSASNRYKGSFCGVDEYGRCEDTNANLIDRYRLGPNCACPGFAV